MVSTTPGALEIRTDADCLTCKTVVKLVVKEVDNGRTEERIIGSLETICLPVLKLKQGCDTFVQQYANELIHILVEEEDPELACTLLGVCKA